jgi:hypothetical protein
MDAEDVEPVVERLRLNRWLVGVRVNLRKAEAAMLSSSNEERLPLSIVPTLASRKDGGWTASSHDSTAKDSKNKGKKTRYMVATTIRGV